MLGPIDYVVVAFRGNYFDGSIVDELVKATKKGTIRVVDLLFIMKDADGEVVGGEYSEQSDELKSDFGELKFEDSMPLFTEDDIAKVGESMENDTAAGILVIEHLWAKGLKKAILDAGGMLIDEGRIHPEVVAEALKEMKVEA